jgi:hypothetical protein
MEMGVFDMGQICCRMSENQDNGGGKRGFQGWNVRVAPQRNSEENSKSHQCKL